MKDWTPGFYRSHNATKDRRIEVHDGQKWVPRASPMKQARDYRSIIYDRFFARDDDLTIRDRIRVCLVLPQFSDADARALLGDYPLVCVRGAEGLLALPLLLAAPSDDPPPPAACLEILRRWLDEPELVGDQRLPLRLSDGARNVASNPSGAKMRRVRGPAGCGKSLGLASRAVSLVEQGNSVLVVTFNVTLGHYLHDLCSRDARARHVPAWRSAITFTHFHGLLGGLVDQYAFASGPQPDWPGWAIRTLSQLYDEGVHDLPTYDAILVDEGQDFSQAWWAFLRDSVLRPGGEMLLAVDRTQNIYGQENWTEAAASGWGFRGPWTELRGTYRTPVDLVPVVAEYASCYLPDVEVDLPSVERDHPGLQEAHAPTVRRWVPSAAEALVQNAVEQVEALLAEHTTLSPSDVVVLADHATGAAVMDALGARGHDVSHIFRVEDDERRKRLKRRFWAGSPGIKGCTAHSFKGWEARAVVAIAPEHAGTPLALYVAMTRVKGDPYRRPAYLIVINAMSTLEPFQARFERAITPVEVPALAGQRALDV